MEHPRYRFGEFDFDPTSGELTRIVAPGTGTTTRLPPQPARLLGLLADARGEVVTREAIRDTVWRGVKVEFDASLHFCVRQVRTALGDSASDSQYIETLPRRGYRLLPEVQVLPPLAPAPASDPAPPEGEAGTRGPGRRVVTIAVLLLITAAVVAWVSTISTLSPPDARVAAGTPAVGVMPFRPPAGWEGGDPDRVALIADGTLEALVQAEGADLRVVGPSNTAAYDGDDAKLSDLAAAFDLDYIVNGRFGSDDEGPRLLAELIRTSDGAHIWVRRYSDFADVEAITSEITREVLARLTAPDPPG